MRFHSSRRLRWMLGLTGGLVAVSVALIFTIPFVGMVWASVTGDPDLDLVRDVRAELLAQDAFVQTLKRHEREALRRYRASGSTVYQRRHLVRVDLTPLGLPGFHDVFAVRVRTDVVQAQPYTGFLVRPGVVKSANDAPFFSRQCAIPTCTEGLRTAVAVGHFLIDHNVLSTYRLNVTGSDRTSSVTLGRSPVSTSEWARQTQQMHQAQKGRTYTSQGR